MNNDNSNNQLAFKLIDSRHNVLTWATSEVVLTDIQLSNLTKYIYSDQYSKDLDVITKTSNDSKEIHERFNNLIVNKITPISN